MTIIWFAVTLVVILYSLHLIRFNRNWCIISTTFSDEDYFSMVELLRANGIKFLTKMTIDWGRPPGFRTVIDHKQVDFYVRRQDKYIVKQVLDRRIL